MLYLSDDTGRASALLKVAPLVARQNPLDPDGSSVGTGLPISGIITAPDDGTPLAGAIAHLFREDTGTPLKYTVTGAAGDYRFRNVPAGNYAVVVIDRTGTWRGKVIHTVVE